MLTFFFNPNGRVQRLAYLFASVGAHFAFGFVIWLALAAPPSASPEPFSFTALGRIADHPATYLAQLGEREPLAAAFGLLGAAMTIWSFVVLSMKRIRDAGRSFHWMWLGVAGSWLLMLVLLLFPGSTGSPLKKLAA